MRITGSKLRALMLALVVVAVGVGAAVADSAHYSPRLVARVSRRMQAVQESVSARLSDHHGATELIERGAAHGTLSCPLSITIKLSYTQAQITFDCGTLEGRGSVAFYVSGQTGYFHGTLVVTRGRGHYRHSAGSRLSIAGTLHRGTYALSARVSGSLYI